MKSNTSSFREIIKTNWLYKTVRLFENFKLFLSSVIYNHYE